MVSSAQFYNHIVHIITDVSVSNGDIMEDCERPANPANDLAVAGNDPVAVGFSALDMITFSREVTIECIKVIKSRDTTFLSKLWALIRIINNFMNREAFFYIDLIFCLSFCIYNVVTTRLYAALEFYTLGALVVNAVLFWYFSYCRYLNGKDVITLRRSIQLLSHAFQLTTIGMLVLCREKHNHIVDDDHDDHIYNSPPHPHDFTCTSTFLFSNSVRIIWHGAVLFKTFIDEYVSGYLITRGVLLDVIVIVISPPIIVFCLITDICASDVRSYLVRALNVTVEVNDITGKTPFYVALENSMHRNKMEPILFFLIFLSVDIYYLGIQSGYYCVESFVQLEVFILVLILLGWMLMCEFFFCKQLKYPTLFVFLTLNMGVRLWLLVAERNAELCYYNYHLKGDDGGQPIYGDDFYVFSYGSSTGYYFYWKEWG